MKLICASAARPSPQGGTEVRFVTWEDRARVLPGVPEAEFSAQPNALLYLRAEAILYVGVGSIRSVNTDTFRRAAGSATMTLKKIGQRRLVLNLAGWMEFLSPVTEGVILADYRFSLFSGKPSEELEQIILKVPAASLPSAKKSARRAQVIADATNDVREIGNLPGNLLYPASLATKAVKMARESGLKAQVFEERELRAQGFGGLLAVGRGSEREPRFIILEHRGASRTEPVIALVGKAITFDTGGISIKSATNLETMIFDKCGGTAVIGAMAAIARLNIRRNVVGLIASAENMPGGRAYRPGDIITTYDGRHVEVINTDAEGRMVLADAIAYARQECKAAAIIDLATLTGACVVALGEYAAGLFGNDAALVEMVRTAAERTGEVVWPLPIFKEHEEQIKSDVASIKNSGGRTGGACTAAAFLKTFAGSAPWAHLDIAPVAHRDKDRSDLARGATGFGVRLLVELIEKWPSKAVALEKS